MPNLKRGMMGAAGVSSENTFLWGTGTQYAGRPIIGDGTVIARSSPVLSISGLNWTGIGMSQGAVTGVSSGKLYTWGDGTAGALGDGTIVSKSSPTQVGSLTDWVTPLDGGSADTNTTGCIKTDGTLWMWGLNSAGQVGDGTVVKRSSPVQVGSLTNWSKLYSGDGTTYAIKTDGTMWVFGNGGDNSSGTGSYGLSASSPVQIGSATNWAQFDSGQNWCGAIDTDGKLWTWGLAPWAANSGQLGHGDAIGIPTPVQVGSLTDWATMACGGSTACAVKTDGTLWAWGAKFLNAIPSPYIDRSSPVQVGSLTDWSKVVGGNSFMAALKTDGTIWAWGSSSDGRLGDGQKVINFSSPIQIGSGTDWTDVFGSKAENTLWLGPKA